jgi:uncharacterized Zn finger protein (UPF0148 family)
MQKIKLDCDACGAPLEIEHPGFYRCPHCGRTYLIEGIMEPRPSRPNLKMKNEKKKSAPASINQGTQSTPKVSEEDIIKIKELLYKGSKVQAVKLYLDKIGGGLREAKDFVDAIAKTL